MLKRFASIVIVGLLLISCSGNTHQADNSVKMPYNEWRIGARYPSYFAADIISIYMVTQSNQFEGLRIAIGPNSDDNPTQWHIYLGSADALEVNANLPQRLSV